jgi:magnesium-transporting ATPase (P-type)
MAGEQVLADLGATPAGLTSAEAAARLGRFGPNRLPSAAVVPWWRIILRQFISPLIFVLGLAAMLSLSIGETTDAAFIVAVLVINAMIGGSQEWRAERSAHALRRLLQFRAVVERDGEAHEIKADDVVPGDIAWLESGNRVPADGRLLAASGLEVDESLLTGESLPVDKDAQWLGSPGTAVADRLNMVHAGTIVVRGRAKAVVTATGLSSSVGQLAIDVMGPPPGRPPLLLRLDRFGRMFGIASLLAAAVVALIGILGHGRSVSEMALFAIALAVSVIPEGLPVAITVALAVASSRMARRGVIVRRIGAVEGLGSCTLIASDKTGTLTCNELTVREIRLPDGRKFRLTGEGFIPRGEVQGAVGGIDPATRHELGELALAAVLCNEADLHEREGSWSWRGDPTDVALLSMAHKLGFAREPTLDAYPELNRIHFEPERRFAASFHGAGGVIRVFVKGAPERVLSMCAGEEGGESHRQAAAAAEEMAAGGLRVLALAEGAGSTALDPTMVPPQPSGLRLLGFIGMIDPLRPGVPAAIEACGRAGVGVCMVTGDHPTTALAIARDLGLADSPGQVVTGDEFEKASDAEVRAALDRVRVFARVAPHQKLRIVQSAQASGHFVAVTGDGANDAPALRAANIGVAMGRGGTDIARDASDLVITDDNFATIVVGIEEGRIAYDNVRKVVYILVSTGAAEVVATVAAIACGMPLPLLPVQLLWLNLVTNGIQVVALAFEPGEKGVLNRAPRPPREPIFNRLMVERTIVAACTMGGVTFGAFWWMLEHGWSTPSARNALLLLLVLFVNIHLGNCRSETRSALVLSPLRSPVLLTGTIGAFLVHVVAMHLPGLRSVLATEPVGLQVWITLFGLALTVFVAMELHKLVWAVRARAAKTAP